MPTLKEKAHPWLSYAQGFAQSPQGQSALLAFANAALQSSQNPSVPQGLGLLNALSTGAMAHQRRGESEEEKRWKEEYRGIQRRSDARGERADARAEEAHKASMDEDVILYKDDGSSVKIKRSQVPEYLKEGWTNVKPPTSSSRKMPGPTGLEMSAILAGQYPNNPWGYTPESAKETLDTYKKYYGSENLLNMLLRGNLPGAGWDQPTGLEDASTEDLIRLMDEVE